MPIKKRQFPTGGKACPRCLVSVGMHVCGPVNLQHSQLPSHRRNSMQATLRTGIHTGNHGCVRGPRQLTDVIVEDAFVSNSVANNTTVRIRMSHYSTNEP